MSRGEPACRRARDHAATRPRRCRGEIARRRQPLRQLHQAERRLAGHLQMRVHFPHAGQDGLPVASMTVASSGTGVLARGRRQRCDPAHDDGVCRQHDAALAVEQVPVEMASAPATLVTARFATASPTHCATSVRWREGRSSGWASGRTVMNHCTSVASNSPFSSSQMPLGVCAPLR